MMEMAAPLHARPKSFISAKTTATALLQFVYIEVSFLMSPSTRPEE